MADTIIQNFAMVIMRLNTPATYCAMSSMLRPQRSATVAEVINIPLFFNGFVKILQEFLNSLTLGITGITARSHLVADKSD